MRSRSASPLVRRRCLFPLLGLLSIVVSTAPASFAQAPAPAAAAEATAAAAPAPPDPVEAPDPDPWPRRIETESHTIDVFPPELERWDGSTLEARSAVQVTDKAKQSRLYGVFRFTARTRTDREARLVVVDELLGVGVTLPGRPEAEARLLALLDRRLSEQVKVVSLDRLEAALAALEPSAARASLAVRNEPPAFVFAERPTLLVLVDGSPAWRAISGTSFDRLLNTRPLVLRNESGFYLRLFDGWLFAPNLAGPWKVPFGAPRGLDEAASWTLERQPADLLTGGTAREVDAEGAPIDTPTLARGPVPDVVVAVEATELVVFDGPARWARIEGTSLEFVENTTGNVFRGGSPARHWLLVSGRWFAAPSLDGPWSFVAQSELDPAFAAIPDDSAKENVKASVAGTPQAREAVIADAIPQTAEIARGEAKFTPRLDGAPEFEPIPPTGLEYAVNSPTAILRVPDGGGLLALYDAVWFEAPAVEGPWRVADEIPEAVYAIPPEHPLHYVTYVRVYDADEEVVVVGYTPGYHGTVVADGTVVCGTGWAYDPWIGSTWYGAPATYGYGCGMTYTPWNGWAFTYGVGWAWGYWGGWYAPYYPPYWGGYWGYYPWYGGAVAGPGGGWAAWGPGGWAGSTGNIYRQWGSVSSVSRYSGGFDAWSGTAWRSQVGAAYNSRTGTIAAGQRGAVGNIYSGNYAFGGRGVAQGPGGATVAGGRVTAGNVGSGNVTAGRVGAYDPATGQGGSAGWVRGDQGGVARVGDDYYAGHDGNVYRRNGQGDWSQVGGSGDWQGVGDAGRAQQLDRQYGARSSGSQRYSGYRSSMPRGGGGMRAGGGGRRR